MKYICIVLASLVLVVSCKQKETLPKEWVFTKTIQLNGINPIGIAEMDGKLWLSDGDHNRLVQIDTNGKIEQIIDSLDRPMHIDAVDGVLFIPEYGQDAITAYDKKGRFQMQLADSLDAPAGISVFKDERAIADFYTNRILYFDGSSWISFGKEGKANGEFYYPTDVQITEDKIWVADAYNNRIQIFDKKGTFVNMMGQDQKMNAATGIFVSNKEVFVTDFENDRVLVFDHQGNLQQELKAGIDRPTDMLLFNDALHIINYRTGELAMYMIKTKTGKP